MDLLLGISQDEDQQQFQFDYTFSTQDPFLSLSDDAIPPNSMIPPASSLNNQTFALNFEVDMPLPTSACPYNYKGMRQDGTETYPGLEVQTQLSDYPPLPYGVVVQGNSTGPRVPREAPDPFGQWNESRLLKCARCDKSKDADLDLCIFCIRQEGSSRDLGFMALHGLHNQHFPSDGKITSVLGCQGFDGI